MKKFDHFIGIDISKETFDVYSEDLGHAKYSNNHDGFVLFLTSLKSNSQCVMEATGSYHQRLAHYLYEHNVVVSVVNPLVIKRYIQMMLHHTKSDKSDAKMIACYAKDQKTNPWIPDPEYIDTCKMLQTSIEMYFKQSTALKNKVHSLNNKGITKGILIQSLMGQISRLKKEINKLEEAIERLIIDNEQALLTNLKTIPGIGKKTALLLIASTNGFRSFENGKQLSAFFGLAPRERTSGSSIRGKARITKAGAPRIRNHLFLCSFTACQCNPQCKALYQRIVAKGKSKKLALIAVANKLLKQTLGIAKSGICYDPQYHNITAN